MSKISLIVPNYNDHDSLVLLLNILHFQKKLPDEIIIIDSSESFKEVKISNYINNKISYIHKKINKSYPGRARNIGMLNSKYDLIAFLDCKTFPNKNWLFNMHNSLIANKSDVVLGLRSNFADTPFKELLKNSTYGNKPVKSVTGSIFKKKEILNLNLFFDEKVRAGEDLLWIKNLNNSKLTISNSNYSDHVYCGFVDNLKKVIIKWFIYSINNSKINIMFYHKLFYFLAFIYINLYLFVMLFYLLFKIELIKLNLINFSSISFIVIYFLYRSFIRPLLMRVSLKKIFPFYWLKIFFMSFLLDLIKIPGGAFGFINYFLSNKNKKI